ncbi:MAG: helix-turn-helix transcriptional regulator [Lachnospiraceae bacterium]|nr:helix-turn-helix transcriptional regulator [Lachnospiraceae bacterium]
MKINQIIREKRKELSLTQEQIADFLGVSAPAVSKWEKGSTYPDITLLPALARLLKIDLNTLMSFHDDLTDIEIENFVNEIDRTIKDQNYDAAFQKAINKIHEYPTCEKLIYAVILYLEGALILYNISEIERYRKIYETFYRRLAASEIPEIRGTATLMLISYARNQGDFSKAEELINSLPFSTIDKEKQLAILYQRQERYPDAEKFWEHRVYKGVTEIQTSLLNMLEIALQEKRENDADFFADTYEAVTRQFCFPEWMCCNAHLLLALVKKDKDRSLSILQKMLPAMKKEWNLQDCQLYRNINGRSSALFSSKLAKTITDELANNEEYAFLRDDSEFEALIAQTFYIL